MEAEASTGARLEISDGQKSMIRIRYRCFVSYLITFPTLGFIMSVALTFIKDYEQATLITCGRTGQPLPNFAPSVSKSFSYEPQKYIWQGCIALSLAPRLLEPTMIYTYLVGCVTSCSSIPLKQKYMWLSLVYRATAVFLGMVIAGEILSLTGLTLVITTENLHAHVKFVYAFLGLAFLHKILTICLLLWARVFRPWSRGDRRSFMVKLILCLAFLASCLSAAYFNLNHRWYCTPHYWSLFVFSEYAFVSINIAFHASWLLHELKGSDFLITLPSLGEDFDYQGLDNEHDEFEI